MDDAIPYAALVFATLALVLSVSAWIQADALSRDFNSRYQKYPLDRERPPRPTPPPPPPPPKSQNGYGVLHHELTKLERTTRRLEETIAKHPKSVDATALRDGREEY